MYKFMCLCTKTIKAKSYLGKGLNPSLSQNFKSHSCGIYFNCPTCRLATYVRRWTSRPPRPSHDVAGPSLNKIKLRPAATRKQPEALEARMWLRTQAQWRNSSRLERWLVAVQLTSGSDRLTRLGQNWIGGEAGPGQYPSSG